jgi:hypothetical protein
VTLGILRRVIIGAAATASISIGASLVSAQDVVEIRLRGRYFSDPATVRITVAVEPQAENRALRVEADGDRLFRSSEVLLDGERGKRLHTVEFKNLPAGNYTIRAAVRASAEVIGTAEDFVVVGDPANVPH